MKKENEEKENPTPIFIPTESIIEGYIKTKKSFRVECKYFGTIMSSQKVVVGESSKITGDIVCRNLDLAGELEGNIFCSGKIKVYKGSKIKGKVYTQLFENDADSFLDCIVQIPDIKHVKTVEDLLDKMDVNKPLSLDDTLEQVRNIFYNNVYSHKINVDTPLVYDFTSQRKSLKAEAGGNGEEKSTPLPEQPKEEIPIEQEEENLKRK